MGRNTRKRRSPLAVRAVAASAALAIGGGGLIWANFYASAHETNSSPNTVKAAAAQVATISCPDIGQKLTNVPANAKSNVDAELATLDKQITEAYARLASSRQAQANDAGFVQNAILSPLQEKRNAVIGRIKIDFTRVGAAAPPRWTVSPPAPAPPPPRLRPPPVARTTADRTTTARTTVASRTTARTTAASRTTVAPRPARLRARAHRPTSAVRPETVPSQPTSSTSRRSHRTSWRSPRRPARPRGVRSPRSAV